MSLSKNNPFQSSTSLGANKEPSPPNLLIKTAGHHWLRYVDADGRKWDPTVLQWNPVVKRWCNSGEVATGRYRDVEGYEYVAPCPIPE